jgi:ATP-dependent 26S proteasome regulatory subunit
MRLCPTQQKSFDRLLELWPASDLFVLWSRPGLGRSTLLRKLKDDIPGAALFDVSRWFLPLAEEHPAQLEETFVRRALARLKKCDVLLIDDYERFACVTGDCNHFYQRRGLQRSALLTLAEATRRSKKKLLLASTSSINEEIDARTLFVGWDRLDLADYRFLFDCFLDEKAKKVDVERVFQFASRLSIHQIRGSLEVLRREPEITTDRVIAYLEQLKMASNINVSHVRDVSLEDLKGVGDVVEALQRFVINPLSEEALARQYGVRPKRGILLFGPPGTGKTTVGRALARRLRSKFFRIDGTFITRSNEFYQRVSRVFESAKENAPSLIFIDDCDTIFEDRDEYGLYRYLLTMLDGLESEDMAGVSVMMTAMNVGSLPPALIRSGRIELWLEMKLPDLEARREILAARVASMPGSSGHLDLAAIANATDGFTGADLGRLVDDAKALLLADLAASRPANDLTRIFLAAVDEVRRNMSIIQAAAAKAEMRPKSAQSERYYPGLRNDGEDTPPSA